jgi:hypothetical protein
MRLPAVSTNKLLSILSSDPYALREVLLYGTQERLQR